MKLAVVIPTVTGREESVARCASAYAETSPQYTRFYYQFNQPSCGEAWLAASLEVDPETTHIHFTADDLEPMQHWWVPAIQACDAGYLPAAMIYRPNGELEAAGGDLDAVDHVLTDVGDDWSEVDYSGIPFLPMELFRQIGMPPLHYYSDVWISHVARKLKGIKTVLRHDYSFTHHREEAGRGAGYDQIDRDFLDRVRFQNEMKARFGVTRA